MNHDSEINHPYSSDGINQRAFSRGRDPSALRPSPLRSLTENVSEFNLVICGGGSV